MKYNIVKLVAPANNTLHKSFSESILLNNVEEVEEYLKDQEEMYKGFRPFNINFIDETSLVETDPEQVRINQTHIVYKIENEHIVAQYHCKLEDVAYYREDWDRDINEDDKPCHDTLPNRGRIWTVCECREGAYIASFDDKDHMYFDIWLEDWTKNFTKAKRIRLRLFLSDTRSYENNKIFSKIEGLREYLTERISDIDHLLEISISPSSIILQSDRSCDNKVFRFKNIKFKVFVEDE